MFSGNYGSLSYCGVFCVRRASSFSSQGFCFCTTFTFCTCVRFQRLVAFQFGSAIAVSRPLGSGLLKQFKHEALQLRLNTNNLSPRLASTTTKIDNQNHNKNKNNLSPRPSSGDLSQTVITTKYDNCKSNNNKNNHNNKI